MTEYIEREAFLADKKWLYCTDCDKRKGKKRGKMVTLYEIGEAPCKSCGIHDMLEEVEDYPAADVRPVVNTCETCGYKTERIRVKPYDGACWYWKLHSIKNEEWCCHWKQMEESLMYDDLIAELRQHHCDAKEDDTQEVCEECSYDVIIVDKSAPSGFASVCVCGLMNRAADAIEELQATLCNWGAVCPEDKRDISTCEIYESCRTKPPKEEI